MIQTSLWQEPVGGIIPREYQVEDVASSFRLWDSGTVGVLTRMATGMGKTISSCLKFRRWLDAGDNYRCMVLSYERELVQQFAEEVLDVLGGVSVGIEMGAMEIDPDNIPQIVVASRQTLMTHELATVEQREVLKEFGLSDVKLLTKRAATSAIIDLRKGIDLQTIADGIDEFNSSNRCNHELGRVSRLYKFDNKLNWLLVMDEAHKYSMQLKTVGHIIEWFEQNPLHRRSGITATPKRRDKVSIGTKLFPGISIDYPLTRAVEQGYAVPYIQKFVQVDSVDFKAIKEIAGKSQEKWDNEVNRRIEQDLAKLCDPLLDMVGDRRTLIFSPSVELAGKVCEYINARSECECSCGTKSWHPRLRIGDGAKCHQCGEWLESKHITKDGIQAYSLHGGVPHRDRKSVYEGHKEGKFQFLSVCGLCLDGDSLILTDRGEVPLKEVTRQMKLWDGIEFVSHDGVIFKGSKPVITYAGLTATGDHNVWTDTGWQSFSSCKQRRVEIRVGGIEGMPVGNLIVTTGDLVRVGKSMRAGLETRCVECGRVSIKVVSEMKRGNAGCKSCSKSSGVPNWLLMRCRSAKKRCENPNDPFFKDYGARGIRFLFDTPALMGKWVMENLGLHREMTLDRKNNSAHYEPGNLRWASQSMQANNRRARRRGYKRSPNGTRRSRKSTTS